MVGGGGELKLKGANKKDTTPRSGGSSAVERKDWGGCLQRMLTERWFAN